MAAGVSTVPALMERRESGWKYFGGWAYNSPWWFGSEKQERKESRMTPTFFPLVTVWIFVSFYWVGEGLREELVLRSELEYRNFCSKCDFELLFDVCREYSGSNRTWTQELGGFPCETEASRQPASITARLNFCGFSASTLEENRLFQTYALTLKVSIPIKTSRL